MRALLVIALVLPVVGHAAAPNCSPTCYPTEPPAGGGRPECGMPNLLCEPLGSKTARAINIVHFRVEEAKTAQSAGKKVVCQDAARAAVATASGLNKFRDQQKAQHNWGTKYPYKTRYDGTLDEQALFAKVDEYKKAAEGLFKSCGGTRLAATPEEEMAFIVGAPNPKIRMANAPPTIDNEDARTYEYDLVGCVESSANHHGQLTAHSRTVLHHNCTLEVRGASGRAEIHTDMTCVVKSGVLTCKP
jgi:hypothetical protein